jgi:hypothetical protein
MMTAWVTSAWALDDAANLATGPTGKAAAHAALSDGADVPAHPPQLPESAADRARDALANTAFGKTGQAQRRARTEARERAAADARSAHADAANQAAQGSLAAAARGANADGRAAAAQARASAAKENAAAHRSRPLTAERP